MNEYTYRFYSNDKHVHTQTFHTVTEENANHQADNLLRIKKSWDDWELVKPKVNVGSQKSPFGL